MNQQRIAPLSLDSESLVDRAYSRVAACADDPARIMATAQLILAIFDDFYSRCASTRIGPCAPSRAWIPHASIRISNERLGLYSRYIAEHGPRIATAFPRSRDNPSVWDALDRLFVAMIVDRYEADTAFSFAHSLRRNICHEIWRPVAYSFPPPSKLRAFSMAPVHRRLPVQSRIDVGADGAALRLPGFSVPFRDLKGDCAEDSRTAQPLLYGGSPMRPLPVALDVVEAGFFRDRNAFVVGRWVLQDGGYRALVVALLNSRAGIYADARPASGGGHSRPVQLGARQLPRHDPALLPDLRVSLQPDAAAAAWGTTTPPSASTTSERSPS